GFAPLASSVLLWMLYLSLVSVGGVFMGYQWDNLLLETGLLAVFIAPWGLRPRGVFVAWLPRLALRFLLFRLMLASGLVKLLSGDPAWRSLTALTFHYETQPLPTWIGWYFEASPLFFHKLSAIVMFVVEILCPFFIFGPRKARLLAFSAFLFLQALIALTGNYGFFNLLAIVLCLVLLDDTLLPRWLRGEAAPPRGPWPQRLRSAAAGVTMLVSLVPFLSGLRVPLPSALFALYAPFEPFRSTNAYGLFAVMTRDRPEIVVEGSLDGTTWVPYAFRYKPGDLHRPPPFVAPHQPRLDWQMWFAALGNPEDSPWFSRFLLRLLEASPPVLGLLERDPFDGRPPRYIRAQVYRYHFARMEIRGREGVWWTREFVGQFTPVFEQEP
ncbi:MAG TPA: lipase maturation factor family protein, partial [Vicinamibacteria bacterium]|nr:lipase maturation factor family protein [Vicinamibacteria bacterium]